LEKGLWVLSDRFHDATLAYQGYGRGLDPARLRSLQEWATHGVLPHRTVLLDCSVETALERRARERNLPDRIEAEERDFHERVRGGYLELAAAEPGRFLVLDAEHTLEEVVAEFDRALGGFGRAQNVW
jgi:dTMP kinase